MKYKLKALFGILIIFAILIQLSPLISAYNGWGGYYGRFSPSELMENEWVTFGAIFLIFFAIVYYTINKSFKNKAIAAVVGLGVSSLISLTLVRRGWLYGYLGDEIGTWLLIAAFLIGIGFLLKFAFEAFGKIGATAAIIAVWLFFHNIDPYEILPYQLQTETLIGIYEFISSIPGLIILIILTLIIIRKTQGSIDKFVDKMSVKAKKLFK